MVLTMLFFNWSLQKVEGGVTLQLGEDKLRQCLRNNYYAFTGLVRSSNGRVSTKKGKVFVGWFPHPVANPFPAIKVSPDSGVSEIKGLEEHAERSSVKDLLLSNRIGYHGSAFRISGSIRGGKKRKQVCVVARE